MGGHISASQMERYALGSVKDEWELASLEKHLLACGWCKDRAQRTEGVLEPVGAVLIRLEAKRRTGWPTALFSAFQLKQGTVR